MKSEDLEARVERVAADRLRVLSPALGFWTHDLRLGMVIGPGSMLGRLTQLGKSRVLLLPAAPAGTVASGLPQDRKVPVDHGQALFELVPLGVGETAASAVVGHGTGLARTEGTLAVVSPTDGVFYRVPSPGASPFVEVGSRVREGEAVGLVEVMKTFNHIFYGGPSLPPEAEVVEVCCADAQEVRAGETLMRVRRTASET